MTGRKWIFALGFALPCIVVTYLAAEDQVRDGRTDREGLTQPLYKVANKLENESETKQPVQQQQQGQAQAQGHPLDPALAIAYRALANIQANIQDYTCTLVKRERIDGKLLDSESMFLKIRHTPFSVYTYFKSPESMKGQEALYVAGQNDGNLLGHGVGVKKLIGTLALKPDSTLAMRGNRYPITEIGFLNLTKRLIEVAEQDKKYGECEVKFYKGAKINNRLCLCIEVIHPVERKNFRFHKARVFVDDEMNIPVRYEAYLWPTKPGAQPPLLEEYTYVDVKVNQGLAEADFDDKNPSYAFH